MFLEDVPRAGSFRVALVWPNLYFVGMSNLGFQAVYRLLNRTPDVVCERAFLPDDEDKAELERTGSPLTSFETGTPLRDFDAIAFSISFENDYLHVLQVLRLAGIPLRAKDRGPRDPLVILGGAAMFLNPEPLAPFADLVAVGEGEPMVPRMMEALLGAADPPEGPRGPPAEGRLLRPLPLRGPLPRGRHGGRLRRPGSRHAPARLAGRHGLPAVGHPHPAHRDVHEVHGGDLARLPLHVPLLLGGLQLPAGPRLHAERARGAGARGAGGRPQDRPRLDRGLRPPGDRRDRGRPRGHGLRGLGRLAAARRPHPAVRLQARRHRRPGPDPRPRVRLRPHAEDPQQAVHERRDPRQGHLDLRERHPEPEALLHGRAALRGARGRRGDRRPHRPDPRADAAGRARPRAGSAASTRR